NGSIHGPAYVIAGIYAHYGTTKQLTTSNPLTLVLCNTQTLPSGFSLAMIRAESGP
ncbi:hypothetical protein M378DRAFT_172578, partial [Amanita muscaria Koide BX008]